MSSAQEGAGGVVAAEGLADVAAEILLTGRVEKVSIAPPRLLVEATPRAPAPDDSITRPTFSLVTARETTRPL